METRASYVVVGTFVLALIAAAFGVVLFLTRTSFEDTPKIYLSYFTGSVTGLQVGSPVRYRGVPVGSVNDIRIDPTDVERVRVIMEIVQGTPIKTDTKSTLGLQGITGVAYIELTGGTRESAPLTAPDGGKIPEIPSKDSGIQKVLATAPELLERAVAITERLALILDDRNVKSISDTLENVSKLTGTLASSSGQVDQLIADSQKTFTALRQAADGIAALTGGLNSKLTPIADGAQDVIIDVQKAVRGFNRIASQLEIVVDENRDSIRDFSSGGLYELSQFIAEGRVLISALTRLSAQIERDPARFFFGDNQKGFEAK
jgi:phospholipid/cholesterol/gamma-HCH transport system substrate-binding protein